MYKLGTVLHGVNPKIGNLWIVYEDNTLNAVLLWNGKTKQWCPTGNNPDRMKHGMKVATYAELNTKMNYGPMPQWAVKLMNTNAFAAMPAPLQSKATVAPAAQQSVSKALGMKTAPDLNTTPQRVECKHSYKPYYGLTDNFDYCIHCDHKVRMKQ